MHPEDVARLVAEQVAELKTRAAAHGQVEATGIQLLEGLRLHVPLILQSYRSETVRVGSPIFTPEGGIQRVASVPLLGNSESNNLLLALDCSDFDADPPTAELLLPDGSPLPAERWPRDPQGQGIVHNHPNYKRPFFCRPGLREYHEHPQHEDDPWDRYREGTPLYTIILGLAHDLGSRWILQ